MSLDFHKPLSTKKMKKRKELDALVSSEKLSTKYASGATNGGVSGSVNHRVNGVSGVGNGGAVGRKISRVSHQLLEESASNSENEQPGEMSGDGEVYAQVMEMWPTNRDNSFWLSYLVLLNFHHSTICMCHSFPFVLSIVG